MTPSSNLAMLEMRGRDCPLPYHIGRHVRRAVADQPRQEQEGDADSVGLVSPVKG